MGASATLIPERLERHHRVPRCLLTLREKADATSPALDGTGFQAWLDYEHEAIRWGVDPDISRDELAALVEASTVVIPAMITAASTARTSPGADVGAAWRRWSATAGRGSSPSVSAATGASRAGSSRRRPLSLRGACSKTNERVTGCGGRHHSPASGPVGSGCRGLTTPVHLARRGRGAGFLTTSLRVRPRSCSQDDSGLGIQLVSSAMIWQYSSCALRSASRCSS
jgi:hypothetical protein